MNITIFSARDRRKADALKMIRQSVMHHASYGSTLTFCRYADKKFNAPQAIKFMFALFSACCNYGHAIVFFFVAWLPFHAVLQMSKEEQRCAVKICEM